MAIDFFIKTSKNRPRLRRGVPVRVNKTCISIDRGLLKRNNITTDWCGNMGRDGEVYALMFSRKQIPGFPAVTENPRSTPHSPYNLQIPRSQQADLEEFRGDYKVLEVRHVEEQGRIFIKVEKAN